MQERNELQLPSSLIASIMELPSKPPGAIHNWKEAQVMAAACRVLKIPFIEINSAMLELEAYRKCPEGLCERLHAAPLFSYNTLMVFACSLPWEKKVLAELRQTLHAEIILIGCTEKSLVTALSHLKSIAKAAPPEQERAISFTHVTETGWDLREASGKQQTDLVKDIIRKAFEMGASDIHIEPFSTHLDIRFRIHGTMVVMPPVEKQFAQKVIDNFKLLASVRVSDRGTLKDGRISIPVTNQRSLDLRVAVVPTLYGESIVARLLDPESIKKNLGRLPFEGNGLELAQFCLSRPNGLIIVTGPTGSGKTTTLYRCLTSMNLSKQKVITIEDPIEYTFSGITQIQTSVENNVTFATALRSVLRMDPEIIMVGEIRDPETANLAIQASLTGHLVLTTLHTNDSVGVVPRLLDLKITPNLITSSLLLVIAQRLLGRLCPICRERLELTTLQMTHFERYRIPAPEAIYKESALGCEGCNFSGITGMVPIFEFLHCNQDMRQAILAHETEKQLRSICDQRGHYPLIYHALQLAAQGTVSYEEAQLWESESGSR